MKPNFVRQEDIKKRFFEFHEVHPGVPLREAAYELEIREAELLSCFIGDGARFLHHFFPKILESFCNWTPMQIEVRSENGIIQKDCTQLMFQKGAIQSEELTIYPYPAKWKYAFAVNEGSGEEDIEGLQVFNDLGHAVFKLFLNDEIKARQYENDIQRFCSKDAEPLDLGQSFRAEKKDKEFDPKIATEAFAKPLVDSYKIQHQNEITPTQHLRLYQARYVSPHAFEPVILKLQETKLPLYFWLENDGTLIEAQGIIEAAYPRGPWYYLQDKAKHLRIRARNKRLGSAWIAKRNIAGNVQETLEYYDKTGDMILGISVNSTKNVTPWQNIVMLQESFGH